MIIRQRITQKTSGINITPSGRPPWIAIDLFYSGNTKSRKSIIISISRLIERRPAASVPHVSKSWTPYNIWSSITFINALAYPSGAFEVSTVRTPIFIGRTFCLALIKINPCCKCISRIAVYCDCNAFILSTRIGHTNICVIIAIRIAAGGCIVCRSARAGNTASTSGHSPAIPAAAAGCSKRLCLVYGHLVGTADGQLRLRGTGEYQADQKAEDCDRRQDNKAFPARHDNIPRTYKF